MRGINVAHHAQVVHKGGEAGPGFIVTKQLRLAAAGGKRVFLLVARSERRGLWTAGLINSMQ